MLTGEANIKRQAELHFINLVGTTSRVEGLFQPARLLSYAHRESLIKGVTAEEVEQVVKNMDPDNPPGPDRVPDDQNSGTAGSAARTSSKSSTRSTPVPPANTGAPRHTIYYSWYTAYLLQGAAYGNE